MEKRRNRDLRAVLQAALAALAAGAPAAGCACEAPAGFPLRADSPGYAVFFRTAPGSIDVGNYFSIEAVACAKAGGTPPDTIRVDAQMPAHRHGMNSRATLERIAPGHFIARGLLFHMPGVWQVAFDVQGASGSERATRELELR